MSELFIVATPIGNLSDISQRALDTLKSVDIIICEDKRVSHKLLDHYNIVKDTLTYNQHSSDAQKYQILKILLDKKTIALLTDAGTPGISDPGNELIDFLLTNEPSIKITPIPGPSSLTTALSICGFDVSKFTFIGFLPKKKKNKLLISLLKSDLPFVFFESPNRITKTLKLLKELEIGERCLFIARELTKLHEQTYRGKIDEVLGLLQKENLKGEFVIVIEKSRG